MHKGIVIIQRNKYSDRDRSVIGGTSGRWTFTFPSGIGRKGGFLEEAMSVLSLRVNSLPGRYRIEEKGRGKYFKLRKQTKQRALNYKIGNILGKCKQFGVPRM